MKRKTLLGLLIGLILLSLSGCFEKDKPKHNVTIITSTGGFYYYEYIVEAKLDDKMLNSNGTTSVEVEEGKHTIIWTYAHKNGMGMYLDQVTKIEEVDVTSNITVNISGSLMTIN